MAVQILLVDDHSMVNEGISRTVISDKKYRVTRRITKSDEVIAFLKTEHVDIIILDIDTSNFDSSSLLKEIKKIVPEIKIICLSIHADFGTIHGIIESGSDGFLLKDVCNDELFNALSLVMEGKTYLNNDLQQVLLNGIRNKKKIPGLTNKEKEVLRLIAGGLTNKEIASELHLGEETIKSHRKNIMHKFDIHNTAELVRFSIDHNLI